jgi:hypothetical protein
VPGNVPNPIPSSSTGHTPVTRLEVWEADFISGSRIPELGTDRSKWPPRGERDLVLEFPVRAGEIPSIVCFDYARQQMRRPWRGTLRRIR